MYDECFDFDENLIKVTEYNVLGNLPDPFLMADGTTVQTACDWDKRKKEMYRSVIELQYGTLPPKPEVLRVEPTYVSDTAANYRIVAGTKQKQVSFMMKIIRPTDQNPSAPIVIDGDGCFNYANDTEYIHALTDRGIHFVLFNRTELAVDEPIKERIGPLYEVYPEYSFGAIGAWAWGYSRCVDALEKIGEYDLNCIAFTGHSRGGKTAMLAGVLDERADIVNPNETNQGSCSCYRITMKALTEDGKEKRNETLEDICRRFAFWFGKGMNDYVGHAETLPFDAHFLKAMVAPRILLIGEAASDIWTSPIGSWQTTSAAKEVYKFLGCEQNLLWYFRKGYHKHLPADLSMLADVICHYQKGEPLLYDRFFKTPFPQPELIFDWKCPETK